MQPVSDFPLKMHSFCSDEGSETRPSPRCPDSEGKGTVSSRDESPRNSLNLPSERVRPLVLKDVFITPSFDELDAVAVDTKGDCQKLNSDHLGAILQKG